MTDEIEVHIHLLSAILRPAPGMLMDLNLLDKLIEHDIGQFCDIAVLTDQLHEPRDISFLRTGRCLRLLQLGNTGLKLCLFLIVLGDQPLCLTVRDASPDFAFIKALDQIVQFSKPFSGRSQFLLLFIGYPVLFGIPLDTQFFKEGRFV